VAGAAVRLHLGAVGPGALHFTDQKAKELKSQLERAARKLKIREPLPRIEAVVFLSA
jgi:hypothetical protein